MRRLMILIFLLVLPKVLYSKVYLEVGRPEIKKRLGVIVFPFKGDKGGEATRIFLKCAESLGFISLKNTEFGGELLDESLFDKEDYLALGVDLIVSGNATWKKSGVDFFLEVKDAFFERPVFSGIFKGKDAYEAVYRALDAFVEHFTGERGIFSTKILFVGKKRGRKDIYVVDFSGIRLERLTRDGVIKLSPRWVTKEKIIFTSYARGQPDLFFLKLGEGPRPVFKRNSFRIAGDVSPDGRFLAFTSNAPGNPEIYVMDLFSGRVKRLTRNFSIDVSPRWSPDGRFIAFVSNRAGSPQIYIMDRNGGSVKRLTYKGKYNTTPSWSPDGKFIAFTGMFQGGQRICVVDVESCEIKILSNSTQGECPSFSPNGKYIAFVEKGWGRRLSIMDLSGNVVRVIPTRGLSVYSPEWSPFWF